MRRKRDIALDHLGSMLDRPADIGRDFLEIGTGLEQPVRRSAARIAEAKL